MLTVFENYRNFELLVAAPDHHVYRFAFGAKELSQREQAHLSGWFRPDLDNHIIRLDATLCCGAVLVHRVNGNGLNLCYRPSRPTVERERVWTTRLVP